MPDVERRARRECAPNDDPELPQHVQSAPMNCWCQRSGPGPRRSPRPLDDLDAVVDRLLDPKTRLTVPADG